MILPCSPCPALKDLPQGRQLPTCAQSLPQAPPAAFRQQLVGQSPHADAGKGTEKVGEEGTEARQLDIQANACEALLKEARVQNTYEYIRIPCLG